MVGLSLFFVSIPTDRIVSFVGTENVYIFMYLLAFVGSISTFAGIPYPLFLISFAAGGFNPVLIGLCSALGVVTADSLTFIAVQKGRVLVGERLQASFNRLSTQITKHPQLLTPGLVLYGTLSPLSNDFAVISLSLMRYAYLRVIPPLALGNIFYNFGLAYLGVYAYNWVVGLF